MKTIPSIHIANGESSKIDRNTKFHIINKTKINCDALIKVIQQHNLLNIENETKNTITINQDSKMKTEEYTIDCIENNIEITVGEYSGVARSFATLLQNIFFEEIPERVEDKPKYSGRGLSFDISKDFFNKDDIKKQMFVMFLYKINILQLHLTDDQGGRIEIKSLPKLTEVGSLRVENGEVNGGFLTQEDIKEIVSLGKTLSIQVIPEIDMPGHTLALIHSYPELLCDGFKGPEYLETKFGVSTDVVCISNPKVTEVFKKIIDEVTELFDNTDIFHIGGDECPSHNGTKCKNCVKAQKDKGFNTPYQLQKEFALEIIKYLATKGKQVLCWDDLVAEEKIDNVVVECGREGEMKKGNYCDDLIESGVEFVNMANEHTYGDGYQDENEPRAEQYFGWLTLQEKVYNFEPTMYVKKEENKSKIKGAACGVGTERIEDVQRLEYQIYPRVMILANNMGRKDMNVSGTEFHEKLNAHNELLDSLNIHYFKKGGKYLELKQTSFKIMGEEHVENLINQ